MFIVEIDCKAILSVLIDLGNLQQLRFPNAGMQFEAGVLEGFAFEDKKLKPLAFIKNLVRKLEMLPMPCFK